MWTAIVSFIKKHRDIGYAGIIAVVIVVAVNGWNNFWAAQEEMHTQKLAYENQIQNLEKKVDTLDKSKIKEVRTEKYENGKLVETKTEKHTDKDVATKTDEKKKTDVVFKKAEESKMWIIGANYDFYTKDLYLRGGVCLLDTFNVEAEYPLNFKAQELRLRLGVAFRF